MQWRSASAICDIHIAARSNQAISGQIEITGVGSPIEAAVIPSGSGALTSAFVVSFNSDCTKWPYRRPLQLRPSEPRN